MPLIRFLVALLVVTAFASEAQACGRLAACLMRLFASEAEQDVVTIVVPPPGTQRAQSVRDVELQINPLAPRWGTDRMEQLFEAAYPQLASCAGGRHKRDAFRTGCSRLGNTMGVGNATYEYSVPGRDDATYGIHASYMENSGSLSLVVDAPRRASTGYGELGRQFQLPIDDTHEGLLLRAYRAFEGSDGQQGRRRTDDVQLVRFRRLRGRHQSWSR